MKTYYYEDELNDEFSEAQITPKRIDASYNYSHHGSGRWMAHVFWYRIIARPLAWCYLKIAFGHRVVGRDKLKKLGGDGFFLYGNHTNPVADAFIPSMVAYPKDVYVIVHPNNVSMPVLGKITPHLGALPLPDDREASKHFLEAVGGTVRENNCLMIYPEAHIWPYYTKIRPFTDSSFRYPVQQDKPVMCFTNTYQKRRFGKRPKIVTYVDGPFYPDKSLKGRDRKMSLRNQVYDAMVLRSQANTVEVNRFIRKEEA